MNKEMEKKEKKYKVTYRFKQMNYPHKILVETVNKATLIWLKETMIVMDIKEVR
jgi:hypothetical protein